MSSVIGAPRSFLRVAARARPALVGAFLLFALPQTAAVRAAPPPITSTIITSAATTQPEVALTFDDGPSLYTPQVLSVLRTYHAHATFFVVGLSVGRYPSFVKAALTDGNEIGNHTYTHADLQYLANGDIAAQLLNTQSAIRRATGFTPQWFRPPYGAVDGRVSGVAASLGLRTSTWNADPRDWSLPGAGSIVATVLAQARPGGIVIMHDGGGNRSETVAALPSILQALLARHYRLVTMSQLFGLPWSSMCGADESMREFSRDGIPAHPQHSIYGAWAEQLCSGTNLGPATSREHPISPGVMAQEFATTAHRIVWNSRTSEVSIRQLWGEAASVFAAKGIAPIHHGIIAHAWFQQFFNGHNWGAALYPPMQGQGFRWQRFQYGDAVAMNGVVSFHGR